MKITALDFETANYSEASICAAGIAVFVDGALTDSRHWLVRPPNGHGWFREDFIEIHSITYKDVASERLPFLTDADLVVDHNTPFDLGKLNGTLSHFEIPCPQFACVCSYRLSEKAWPDLPNHKLDTLAAHIGHRFHHHNVQEDAGVAGYVLCTIIKERGQKWVMERV